MEQSDITGWHGIVVAVSMVCGGVLKAVGDRIKARVEERKIDAQIKENEQKRSVSEKDYWQKIETLEVRINELSEAVRAAHAREAAMAVKVAVLERENDHLRRQYHDLTKQHNRLWEIYEASMAKERGENAKPGDN